MLAFLKDDPEYSEAIGAHLLPGFTLKQVGRDAFVNFKNPDKIDLDMARAGWELAKEAIAQQQADVIILDEINIVLQTGMLPVDEVVGFLSAHKFLIRAQGRGRGYLHRARRTAGALRHSRPCNGYAGS